MTDSRVALGMDRLPWLPDEPARPARPARPERPARPSRPAGSDLFGWAVAAVLLVAGASYWLGLRSGGDAPSSIPAQPEATFRLPDPSAGPPSAAEDRPATAPRIEPMVAPPIPIVESERPRREPIERAAAAPEAQPAAGNSIEAAPADGQETDGNAAAPVVQAPQPQPAKPAFTGPWPVRVVAGASGRLVRIGTFRSPRQAKKGWWAIVKVNPTLKRLPALVVPVQSYRNGQVYYRLQMGTTSQAHSAVLCQRMRMIGQSCVVIDERRA